MCVCVKIDILWHCLSLVKLNSDMMFTFLLTLQLVAVFLERHHHHFMSVFHDGRVGWFDELESQKSLPSSNV